MAYKRYFYKNGKKFGPYYYESYRDEQGKIKKRYVGTSDPNEKRLSEPKKSFQWIFILLVGVILLSVIFLGISSAKEIKIAEAIDKIVGVTFKFSQSCFSKAKNLVTFPFLKFTGHASLDIEDSYISGEYISGDLVMRLKSGELIPAD
ncbi:MAG: hypothetical protein ACOYT4_01795, partial [Nanoarchaeota archaeon]